MIFLTCSTDNRMYIAHKKIKRAQHRYLGMTAPPSSPFPKNASLRRRTRMDKAIVANTVYRLTLKPSVPGSTTKSFPWKYNQTNN